MAESDAGSALDGFRLVVSPGDGVVARYPGVVLVVRGPVGGQLPAAERLLRMCEEAALDGSGPPGRRLMRRLAGILTELEPEEVPPFCALADVSGKIAALVHGDLDLVTHGGRDQRLSGAETATWIDRLLDPDIEMLAVASAPPVESPLPLDLRFGAVPGGSALLVPAGADAPSADAILQSLGTPRMSASNGSPSVDARAADVGSRRAPVGSGGPTPPAVGRVAFDPDTGPEHIEPVNPMPTPPPLRPLDSDRGRMVKGDPELEPEDFDSVPLYEPPTDEEPRPPLPVGGLSDMSEAETQIGDEAALPQVQGITCSRGHFNDPSALYCVNCGISLSQRTHEYTWGPRPPLGVLVFDDGATYTVDGDYVLGRQPDRDDNVRAGRARPLMVTDEEGAVSRVHADIKLAGWEVTIADRGSANGTYIAPAGSTIWTPLEPRQAAALVPGTRVQVGRRTFVFDSHHKV